MRVVHVAASDGAGGAARAAYRIHRALVDGEAATGIHSSMRVCQKVTNDTSVIGGEPGERGALWRKLRYRLARLPMRGFVTGSDAFHSVAWPATGLGAELAKFPADIVNLHWLGRDTLSVEEIGALRRPIVWTMHDMWEFCGAEHYSEDRRYVEGYSRGNRPPHEAGRDVNRWTWRRKRRAWRGSMHLVANSRWMAGCARRSVLARECPVSVIPCPLDLAAFSPMEQDIARERLGLPRGVPIVLFGAIGGAADRRKGADLLMDALRRLRASMTAGPLLPLQLVVFGQSRPAEPPDVGFPLRYAGPLSDDASLRLHYTAADVMIVPSRQEAFGQVATESMACGTPVVAFRVGGLPDVVDHQRTGYLAEPLDPASLAEGIAWVLADAARRRSLGTAARLVAEQRWAPDIVARQYGELYREVMSRHAAG